MSRWWIAGVVVCAACANNVPQDRSTGPDGRQKGAQPIALTEGEGRAKGVVTYPGGDRVDWKLIELPEGKRGRLDLQMSYTTPRPGLRVAFDVFDRWNAPVIKAAVGGRGRIRTASIDGATGRYYVRVYAPRRGDAGVYRLSAAFTEDGPEADARLRALEVPDPPKLPDVPPPLPTSCPVFDAMNPVCATTCAPGSPSGWKGCAPPPPTTVTPPPPPPPSTPPTPAATPFTGRVLRVEIAPDGLYVTIGGGKANGIVASWKARVLRGDTSTPLVGGTGTIVRVDRQKTVVRLSLTKDVVDANPRIELAP